MVKMVNVQVGPETKKTDENVEYAVDHAIDDDQVKDLVNGLLSIPLSLLEGFMRLHSALDMEKSCGQPLETSST